MSSRADEESIFKALAHGTRRALLDCLKEKPQTTGMLCEAIPGIDRCTVMQHLKVLEGAGLVVVVRDGRERWNHLDAMPIKRIHDRWIGEYASHAVSILDRLKADLES